MIRPTGNKVLVRPGKAVDQTEGGLYIPDIAQQDLAQGEILAVGPGRVLPDGSRHSLAVSVGDWVWYLGLGGHQVSYEGEDLLILEEEELLAVKE